jgi:hypothetical protein
MKPCPHCAAPIHEAEVTCAFCAPRAPARRAGRGFLLVLGGLALGVAAAVAVPAARGEGEPGSCQPRSWVDWHVAMKRECLTPAYVCHNMTPSKLLEDPDLAAAFRDALVAGDPGPLASLDALVARMRSAYGCSDARVRAPARPFHGPGPRLPPGHPPIPAEPDLPAFGRKGALTI